MDVFVDSASIDDFIGQKTSAFDEGVRATILGFQVEAQTAILLMMEYTYRSGSGSYSSSSYGYGSGRQQQRREVARSLYRRIRDAGAIDDDNAYAKIRRAETIMCLNKAMSVIALRPSESGGFMQFVGTVDNPQRIMSNAELARYQSQLYSQASDLVKDALLDYGVEPEVVYAL